MSAPRPTRAATRMDRWRNGERGAVAIEMVIVLPLLVLLVFSTVEVGFAWRDSRSLANATRAGARVASNLGDNRLADYEALLTLSAALERIDDNDIEMVIVYEATTADGEVPAVCTAGGGTSVAGVCNAYTSAQIAAMTVGDFTGTTSCTGSSPDLEWCPTTRETDLLTGPDYVGVYIEITRSPVTDVFPGGDISIKDSAVMRIEPR